jgi:osmotically-inducible protein OsmY
MGRPQGGQFSGGQYAGAQSGGEMGRGPHAGRGPKGYKRSDDRIREDVCERLADHPLLDASEIEVKLQGGEVTLSGTVESRQAKRLAEDLVEQVSGVKEVHNQLRASQSGQGSHGSGGQSGRSGGKE